MEETVMAVNDFVRNTVMDGFSRKFCFLEKKLVSDGLFGSTTTWVPGLEFEGVERHDTTIEAQQAEQQGTASTYSIYVDKGVQLAPFDRIKRLEDAQVFEVTSASADKLSPAESGMNLAVVQCKKAVGT